MAEFKNRSFIFKVLYILLSIVTFPIFVILFIFRHPLWILAVLLLLGGFAIYYPLHEGVKFDNIATWYQKKYTDLKHETVLKAREKGITELVPQALLSEVKKMEEEAEDAKLPKGENYNSKVARSTESEETKNELKKRSGFKKRAVVQEETVSQESLNENVVNEETNVIEKENVSEEIEVEEPIFENTEKKIVEEQETTKQEEATETNPVKDETDKNEINADDAELELSF